MFDLNNSILQTSNDNGSVPLCEACNAAPAVTKDHMLCARCTRDVNDRIDENRFYFGDDEGACYLAGINPDPRY